MWAQLPGIEVFSQVLITGNQSWGRFSVPGGWSSPET